MARNPLDELEEIIDRLSKQIEEGMTRGPTGLISIPVDLRDEGDEYVVEAEVPGYESEELDLTLSGRHLEIRAERAEDEEDEDREYIRQERRRRAVTRSLHLPEDVDEEGVTADLENGLLTVRVPKREGGEGHEIEIGE